MEEWSFLTTLRVATYPEPPGELTTRMVLKQLQFDSIYTYMYSYVVYVYVLYIHICICIDMCSILYIYIYTHVCMYIYIESIMPQYTMFRASCSITH